MKKETHMKKVFGIFLLLLFELASVPAMAEIRTETVEYKDGDTVLEGYLAYDDALPDKRPGVLIIHEWTGLGDYVQVRAQRIAQMGYIAFAADIYGKGVRPEAGKEAADTAAIYKNDRELTRRRANEALVVLASHPLTDPTKIAAMGYCFGGMVTLELARSGADLKGSVVFHGSLDTPNPADAKNIKGKVLALQGADDPFVPAKDVAAFEEEMRAANVDWQLVSYGGAVHAFTNPAAGNDPAKGAAYNERADKRSWEAMITFFMEIF